MSLNLLSDAAYQEEEIKVDDTFNGRVLRRHRVNTKNRSWSVLAPALIGAMTAALGLVAIIQVVSTPIKSQVDLQDQKAERTLTDFPDIPRYTE